jgi:hypothetical protein
MVGGAITAKTYRDNAAKVRRVAKDMSAPENKASIHFFADNYDNIAKTIESATTGAQNPESVMRAGHASGPVLELSPHEPCRIQNKHDTVIQTFLVSEE